MATFQAVITVALAATLAQGQRPSFAGTRPIGFPELPEKSTTTVDPLSNRFGESGTTERLPLEANGDRDLIERISKFPIDQQPFWYLNWKALEEHRRNPQTFPQRPSQFAETPNINANSGTQNSNSVLSSNVIIPSSTGTLNSSASNSNVDLGNRHGDIEPNVNSGQKQDNKEFQEKNLGTSNSSVSSSKVELGNGYGGIELNVYSDQEQDNTGFQEKNFGTKSGVSSSNVDIGNRNGGLSANVNSQKPVNTGYHNHQRYSPQPNGVGNQQYYRPS